MKQYLLSVHGTEGDPMPPPDVMQQMFKDVDTVNQEMKAKGVWVFGGGLPTRPTRPWSGSRSGAAAADRRPVRRDQGAARRLLGDQGHRPRRGAGLGRARPRWPAWRRSRCGRSRTSQADGLDDRPVDAEIGRRLPAGVRPVRGHPGPRPRRHRPRRGGGPGRVRRRPASAGRPPACRRTRAPGSSPPPATGPSTGSAGRRPARTRTPRPRCCTEPDEPQEVGPVRDDQLRLIFTCCHPALAPAAQVALTLRLLGGLETPEIARAFLVPEPTMAQRIVRAKHKIRDAGIPYRVPAERRAARPAAAGARRALPGLQRGLRGQRGRGPGPRRPVRRGDPAGPGAGRADAGRARGRRPARAAAADRVPAAGPDRAGRARSCCCPTRTARGGTGR